MSIPPERRSTKLFTDKPTFKALDDAMQATQVFPEKAGDLVAGLPAGYDNWLESLCAFDPSNRLDAASALEGFKALFGVPAVPADEDRNSTVPVAPVDYTDLPAGYELQGKYLVEAPVGKGGFGRVYRVIDTFCDMTRALKIVTQDRTSTLERMKQEYRTLAQLPLIRMW